MAKQKQKQIIIKRQINVTGFNKDERSDWGAELDAAIAKIKIKMRTKREKRIQREENQRLRAAFHQKVQQRFDQTHKKFVKGPYKGPTPVVDESGSILLE